MAVFDHRCYIYPCIQWPSVGSILTAEVSVFVFILRFVAVFPLSQLCVSGEVCEV